MSDHVDILDDPRARRRAARAAQNRTDILDAAERTFAERGMVEGSLRDIAEQAGFSTASIYNYFENKHQLFAETLTRRGIELLEVIEAASKAAEEPIARLHAIVDGAVAFFGTNPDFRRMLGHVRQADSAIPSVVAQHSAGHIEEFTRTVALIVGIIEEGQRAGTIRAGAPSALVHLYMTLVYEHVFLVASDNPATALTRDEFHALVDGALRG